MERKQRYLLSTIFLKNKINYNRYHMLDTIPAVHEVFIFYLKKSNNNEIKKLKTFRWSFLFAGKSVKMFTSV